MMKKHSQAGFTIIELSIATLIFSVLLAICMSAFLGVGRQFVKGVNLSLTQQAARTITDSITSDIRFSNSQPSAVGTTSANGKLENYFCVGKHRYKFMLGNQVQSSEVIKAGDPNYPNYGLVREDISSCAPPASGDGATNPVEMLSNDMQLNDLHFGPVTPTNICDSTSNICTITINLVFYGADSSVLTPSANDPNAHCTGSDVGTQFCATTSYTTTVLQSSQ